MRLATEESLAEKASALNAAISPLPRHYNLALLDEPVSGRALKFYLVLTELPLLITDLGLTAEEVFWSRYYWFRRFARLREAINGRDVGLEQQAFQILEHPDPPCDPDWLELESIEAMAERDVAAQLGTMPDGTTGLL
ncbi:hypothetical protein TA3x_003838 [Tundrisphaera sp. TA3]|uniref:hypothetical protein n=1 Tax=Tundrisphaera sp. TA3 TaxID=3435775 RepID=UPI003EB8643E